MPARSVEAARAFLDDAIELAVQNAAAGQGPFGALVVRDGEVLGTGVNTVDRDRDPFAHAEVAAMRDACRAIGSPDLTGAIVVSSCEPCALCRAAAATAGIVTTVYAATRDDVLAPGVPRTDHAVVMERLADALGTAAPEHAVHVPSPRATEPFERARGVGGRR
jgi:guanine deaminase